jgi:hypothetical protein
MFFKTEAQVHFVDTKTPAVETDAMLDIILSPAFYWVKRRKLPVRFLREAKKLAPSVFDDTLPEGEYSYTAYKEGEEYLLFAYNDKAILDQLLNKGIKPSQINRVYFAQSEFNQIDHPVAISTSHVLGLHDGIVVKLPAALSEQASPIDLSWHKCSSHTVDLARYAHIADRQSVIRFGSFMAVLTLLFLIELAIVSDKTEAIEAEQAGLFAKYDLKSTMMQNEAILKQLQGRYEEQETLRTDLLTMTSLKLDNGEHLLRLTRESGTLKAAWEVATPQRANVLASQLTKSGLVFKHQYRDGQLSVEVAR